MNIRARREMNRLLRITLLNVSLLCLATSLRGQDAPDPSEANSKWWSIHFQATSIGQEHGWFYSLYQGPNSLPSHPEKRVSLTATVFAAARLGRWQLVLNPEDAGGEGIGRVTGIAGFTNGEMPRVQQATPALYLAGGT
jgi:high affinity Mn2+ porin